MKPLPLSFLSLIALCCASAQTQTNDAAAKGGITPNLPVGQTYKNFSFPFYSNGHLSTLFSAAEAKSVTVNRAEARDVKIELFDNDAIKPTTTITSPKADLFINLHLFRTRNTVRLDRQDSITTGQQADFDLNKKLYIIRQNVRMVLRNFDVGKSSAQLNTAPTAAASPNVLVTPAPSLFNIDSTLIQTPGAESSLPMTNAAPTTNLP